MSYVKAAGITKIKLEFWHVHHLKDGDFSTIPVSDKRISFFSPCFLESFWKSPARFLQAFKPQWLKTDAHTVFLKFRPLKRTKELVSSNVLLCYMKQVSKTVLTYKVQTYKYHSCSCDLWTRMWCYKSRTVLQSLLTRYWNAAVLLRSNIILIITAEFKQ